MSDGLRTPLARSIRVTLRTLRRAALLGLVALLAACSSPRSTTPANTRAFQFETDTFAYANELVWEYDYDEEGEWKHERNPDEPDYTHHCFVVVRSARQFFQHATFEESQPPVDQETYRQRIRELVSLDPARDEARNGRVSFPGYPDLRSFSVEHEDVLKETCGGKMQSYFQRGHWRMVFPFSRDGQEAEAEALAESVRNNRPPIVHIVTFPKIRINHALLLYGVEDDGNQLRFAAYDPNQPEAPATLTFDRTTQRFSFPATDYWRGGELNAYEIYRAWNY
jgi:hypothetical protein